MILLMKWKFWTLTIDFYVHTKNMLKGILSKWIKKFNKIFKEFLKKLKNLFPLQFVQIRKFLPPHRTMSELELAQAKAKLAKEVLFEVPGQLIGYMKVLIKK